MTYTLVPEITTTISEEDIISTAYAYLKMLDSIYLSKSNSAEVRDAAHRMYQSIRLHFADDICEDFIWPLATEPAAAIILTHMSSLDNGELIANAFEFISHISTKVGKY